MTIQNMPALVKKELRILFNNPSSYIVLIVFLILWQFLFFRNALLVGESSLRILYDYLPWVMLILAPAITMGSISKEKDDGTLEMLLTQPVRDTEVLVAKWISSLIFITAALIFALPVAFSFSLFGPFDWGIFAGQLLSSILFSASLIALGIFISSLFTNQIASLLLTVLASFLSLVIGTELITANLPNAIVPFLEKLSLLSHLESLSRGVIDIRDLLYFASFIVIFLSLSFLQLMKRKYGNLRYRYRTYQIGIMLLTGIFLMVSLLGDRIPGRIDLTAGRIYTLSAGSVKILKNLPDIVTVTLYASTNLPPQYSPILRETKDILHDIKTRGGNKINYFQKDPGSSETVNTEAGRKGIQQIQFNVVGREEFQVKTGFLGIALDYAGKNEVIPFVQDSSDLEYQLITLIHKLTAKEKKKITFLNEGGAKTAENDFRLLNSELLKLYEVSSGNEIATGSAITVLAGPTGKYDEILFNNLRKFLEKGGNLLILADSYSISTQLMSASLNENNINDFLTNFGVTVNKNLVYDLKSNELINFGQGGPINYLLPYPYWIRALPTSQTGNLSGKINFVILPWVNSLTYDKDKLKTSKYNVEELLTTSAYAGLKTGEISIMPDQTQFDSTNLSKQIVAIALSPREGNASGRIIVVGDSDYLSDNFLQNSADNLNFALETLSWLSSDENLAAIAVKKKKTGKLLFTDDNQAAAVKYGNIALTSAIPFLYGSLRLINRRKLKHRKFA